MNVTSKGWRELKERTIYLSEGVDGLQVELEVGVEHVGHERAVDAGRGHLLLELLETIAAKQMASFD